MDILLYLAIVLAGFFAGFINMLAGSGSLLTLPLLIFAGLPANVANGTNRIAILLQNIVGTANYKKQKVLNTKQGFWLAIPAIIGSLIGAQIAVDINEKIMAQTIGGLLLFMFFVILYKPEQWIKGKEGYTEGKPTIIQMVIFFFIGIYGGFIQAGVGLFLLAGLVIGVGADLIKANALKVFIILIYTPFALFIFILNKQVNYELGFILAIGNMLGAYVGSKVAVSWGPKFVRIVLLLVILFSALKLLGAIDWLLSLF